MPGPSVGERAFEMILDLNGIAHEREACLIKDRRFRVDFYIRPDICIEIEGQVWQMGRHQHPTGFIKDIDKYNLLTAAGYKVYRFATDQMWKKGSISTEAFDWLRKWKVL